MEGGNVMKRIYRNIAIGVVAFIALLLVLPLFINVNSFRPRIESELSNTLGRKVEVGDLSLSILRGSVSAANIRIADDPVLSKSPFLTAKSLIFCLVMRRSTRSTLFHYTAIFLALKG